MVSLALVSFRSRLFFTTSYNSNLQYNSALTDQPENWYEKFAESVTPQFDFVGYEQWYYVTKRILFSAHHKMDEYKNETVTNKKDILETEIYELIKTLLEV